MGDRLRAGIPSWYVTSHPGQLSLLPFAGRKTSTAKVRWCTAAGKWRQDGLFHSWINVWVAVKTVIPR